MDRKVFFSLERQRLLSSDFGSCWEDKSRYTSRFSICGSCSRKVGGLNIINADIGNLDVLGFELPAKGSTVKTRS